MHLITNLLVGWLIGYAPRKSRKFPQPNKVAKVQTIGVDDSNPVCSNLIAFVPHDHRRETCLQGIAEEDNAWNSPASFDGSPIGEPQAEEPSADVTPVETSSVEETEAEESPADLTPLEKYSAEAQELANHQEPAPVDTCNEVQAVEDKAVDEKATVEETPKVDATEESTASTLALQQKTEFYRRLYPTEQHKAFLNAIKKDEKKWKEMQREEKSQRRQKSHERKYPAPVWIENLLESQVELTQGNHFLEMMIAVMEDDTIKNYVLNHRYKNFINAQNKQDLQMLQEMEFVAFQTSMTNKDWILSEDYVSFMKRRAIVEYDSLRYEVSASARFVNNNYYRGWRRMRVVTSNMNFIYTEPDDKYVLNRGVSRHNYGNWIELKVGEDGFFQTKKNLRKFAEVWFKGSKFEFFEHHFIHPTQNRIDIEFVIPKEKIHLIFSVEPGNPLDEIKPETFSARKDKR